MQKQERLVLCLVGLPGSGKSTVAETIRRNFPACVFETGDVIREEIRRRGLRYNKENDKKIAEWFHAGRESLIIGRTVKKMNACKRRLAVVSGFFAPEEIRMLNKAGKIVLIAVTAPSSVRYMRQILRGRFANETVKYLRERDRREMSEGLGELLKKAEYRISSNTGRRGLERNAVALVKKILDARGQQA